MRGSFQSENRMGKFSFWTNSSIYHLDDCTAILLQFLFHSDCDHSFFRGKEMSAATSILWNDPENEMGWEVTDSKRYIVYKMLPFQEYFLLLK